MTNQISLPVSSATKSQAQRGRARLALSVKRSYSIVALIRPPQPIKGGISMRKLISKIRKARQDELSDVKAF